MSNQVWIFAEQRDGKVKKTAFELLAKATDLAQQLGSQVTAVLLGSGVADLAVCQHTLVNEADPARAIAELARVVRPGGKVVAFEPNSLIQALVKTSVDPDDDLEARLDLVRYQAYYERGKAKLGFKQKHALETLPKDIAKLDAEIARLNKLLADPALYSRDPKSFADATTKLAAAEAAKSKAEDAWLELEAIREQVEG